MRLAILARGVPALQAVHAVRDLNSELPRNRRMTAVVLHLTEDRYTRFVRDADRAVELGAVAGRPDRDPAAVLAALERSGADAVWSSGWPDAGVSQACETLGLTRLNDQPDHETVAEGIDHLTAQLRRAAQLAPAPQSEPVLSVALRLAGCVPGRNPQSTGRVRLLELPGGPGVEAVAGVSQGDELCAWGSPVLAELTARGTTPQQAVARLSRALSDTTVVVDGATTNKTELLESLSDRYPRRSGYGESSRPAERRRIALVTAAIEAHARGLAADVDTFLDTAARGRPEVGPLRGRVVHLGLDTTTYRVAVLQRTAHLYQLSIESETGIPVEAEVSVDRLDDHRRRLEINGRTIKIVTSVHDGCELVEVAGHTTRVEHRDGSVLRSPIPAIVVAVHVAAGERAAAGAPLAVLESMKLESVVRAPFDCVVGEWYCRPGSHVAHDVPMVRIEPALTEAPRQGTGSADIVGVAPVGDDTTALSLGDDLLGMLLGYDVDEGTASARLATYRTRPGVVRPRGELDILTAYADLDDLRGTSDAFQRYARNLGLDRTELGEEFIRRLDRASSWYVAPPPPPADVLLRIGRAHRQHDTTAMPVAVAVLERWLREPTPPDALADTARAVLERLGRRGRAQNVQDLARAIDHRWYELPRRQPRPQLTTDPTPRLELFDTEQLPSSPGVLLYQCSAKENRQDRRLVAIAEAEAEAEDEDDAIETAVGDCLADVRTARVSTSAAGRIHLWVRLLGDDRVETVGDELSRLVDDPDLEELVLEQGETAIRVTLDPLRRSPVVTAVARTTEPLQPFDKAGLKARSAARRGYPAPHLVGAGLAGPEGVFTELDLDENGALVAVDRGPGGNRAGLVVGEVTTPTAVYPEGVTRILICGDPTRALGAVAEPECARIIAAIDLAERRGVPVEWFALSSGARISMDSGTENMDWVAAALRRIVSFTQDGGEVNVVVAGINVGAQPYWNAEATMLMHTKGVLIMTPASAMVLTGKRSLDFSGGVSADNESGIGGYERVMGPNGQGQYWAEDLAGAADILMRHYDHTYVVEGETGPRRAPTTDPADRDITGYPHDVAGCDFHTVGEIFSMRHNPERKKAFDMRTVMHAVVDQDSAPLERWADMADAQNAVVMDARLGGQPLCLVGVESRPGTRRGPVPADGPPAYSAGTLYPRSSKKLARAINAASGNRPLVVLANLAGFDGSPDSMRNLQLEYGAEIGRAIVNFDGPIVLCVVGRYHGGAFVVFSKRLNPNLTVLAVAGARASVIGGAPAANVVLSGEARRRASADDRIAALEADLRSITGPERLRIGFDLTDLRDDVYGQTLGELAHEFDSVHDIDRAVAVGSVDAVVRPDELRPAIIAALSGGRELSATAAPARAAR